jgi:hypothetical protein
VFNGAILAFCSKGNDFSVDNVKQEEKYRGTEASESRNANRDRVLPRSEGDHMTDGIRFGQGAGKAFKSLAVDIKHAKPNSDSKPAPAAAQPPTAALVNHLASSISNNIASGAAIGKIPSAVTRENKREVAEANSRASKASVEDVENLAKELASRIASDAQSAIQAHKPQANVAHELVSE